MGSRLADFCGGLASAGALHSTATEAARIGNLPRRVVTSECRFKCMAFSITKGAEITAIGTIGGYFYAGVVI
jgi:hypothetical protein